MNSSGKLDPFGEFVVEWSVPPHQMDIYWAEGWRHFGPLFFRRYFMEHEGQLKAVLPLRVAVRGFSPSKSQRRILRRNTDLSCEFQPTCIDDELRHVFALHSQRFTYPDPPILENFLGYQPESVPCQNVTLSVRSGRRLIAASFLDLGTEGVSSVYAIYDTAEARRSLGIFTMLKEIEFCHRRGGAYYYPGYACHDSSPYDYKKQFDGLQGYDWRGGWSALARKPDPQNSSKLNPAAVMVRGSVN